ncbi:MAG: hypothetical protein SVX43_14845 [Cyanobacteriota bacterium]|nr:hypothetical protein [Cyanobacteriota bacterium]
MKTPIFRNLLTSSAIAATLVSTLATTPARAQSTEACSNNLGCTLLKVALPTVRVCGHCLY